MKQFVIIIVFLTISSFQLPHLFKNKKWKEVVTVSLLLSLSFIISLLQSFDFKLANPHIWINALIEALIY